jgi:hypothetical protein
MRQPRLFVGYGVGAENMDIPEDIEWDIITNQN